MPIPNQPITDFPQSTTPLYIPDYTLLTSPDHALLNPRNRQIINSLINDLIRDQARPQPEINEHGTPQTANPETSTRTTVPEFPDVNLQLLQRVADIERKLNKNPQSTDFLTDGPLSQDLYRTILPPNSKIPNIGSFGMTQSRYQDPKAFLIAFKERFQLAGYSDAVMCRVFPTCLEGKDWEWYNSLPARSINTFNQVATLFINRFGQIKKAEKTCDGLLLLQQGPAETTRKFIDRFLEETKEVIDYDDRIALLAVRKGLRKGPLRFQAHSQNFRTLQEFVNFSTDFLRGEEDDNAMANQAASRDNRLNRNNHNEVPRRN